MYPGASSQSPRRQGGYIPSESNLVWTGADNYEYDDPATYNNIMYSVCTPSPLARVLSPCQLPLASLINIYPWMNRNLSKPLEISFSFIKRA